MTETLPTNQKPVNACPFCGTYFNADESHCPRCGGLPDAPRTTDVLPTNTLKAPANWPRNPEFSFDANAILQFTPSGVCVTLSLRTPLVLGRGAGARPDEVLDLTDFNAHQLGVSRRHCLIARQGARLTVTDLGSSNGTFLNGEALPPDQSHAIAHGDELVLGKLFLRIFFSTSS